MRAVDNYDASKGVLFATHAWSWIKERIIREGNRASNTIVTPSNVAEARMKINKVRNEYIKTTGKFPTVDELVSLCSVKASLVRDIVTSSGQVQSSIDATISSDEGDEMTTQDLVGGNSLLTDMLSDSNMAILQHIVSELPVNERFVVSAILGLEDFENYTFGDLVGLVQNESGRTLNEQSSINRFYHRIIDKISTQIKDTVSPGWNKTVKQRKEFKSQELTFELLLSLTDVETLMQKISTLHENEQFILGAVHGLLDDDETWELSDLVGMVCDADGTVLETLSYVQAEYNNILRELLYKIKEDM